MCPYFIFYLVDIIVLNLSFFFCLFGCLPFHLPKCELHKRNPVCSLEPRTVPVTWWASASQLICVSECCIPTVLLLRFLAKEMSCGLHYFLFKKALMHMLWLEGCFMGMREECSIWLGPLWREKKVVVLGLHSWVLGVALSLFLTLVGYACGEWFVFLPSQPFFWWGDLRGGARHREAFGGNCISLKMAFRILGLV